MFVFIRVDLSVLPLLFLGLFVFQLDRMNLGSALTGGLMAAIGITQSDVNLGNQMMFLGIVVLEIPSNMLLQRVSHPPLLERHALIGKSWVRENTSLCRLWYSDSSPRSRCSFAIEPVLLLFVPSWAWLRLDTSPVPSTLCQHGTEEKSWQRESLSSFSGCLAAMR